MTYVYLNYDFFEDPLFLGMIDIDEKDEQEVLDAFYAEMIYNNKKT